MVVRSGNVAILKSVNMVGSNIAMGDRIPALGASTSKHPTETGILFAHKNTR